MNIEIDINKAHAMEQVDKHTSYRAAKTDVDGFDAKRVKKPDRIFLEEAWHEATDNLALAFAGYLSEAPVMDSEEMHYKLTVDDSFRVMVIPNLKSKSMTYVIYFLLWRWYLMLGDVDAATQCETTVESMMSSVKVSLTMRSKKVRLSAHPFP